MIAARFQELVAAGLAPNDAAAQALLSLQQPQQQPPSQPQPSPAAQAAPAPHQPTAPVPDDPGHWASELAELHGMGFVDDRRNLELLVRYQGRMVRVVNALAGGN